MDDFLQSVSIYTYACYVTYKGMGNISILYRTVILYWLYMRCPLKEKKKLVTTFR